LIYVKVFEHTFILKYRDVFYMIGYIFH